MLTIKSIDIKADGLEILAIPVCENKAIHSDSEINDLIKKAKSVKSFEGKTGESISFYSEEGTSASQIVFLGVGKSDSFTEEIFRSMAGKAVKTAIAAKATSLAVLCPSPSKTKIKAEKLAYAMSEGAVLANHIYDEYKSEKKSSVLKKIDIMVEASAASKLEALAGKAEIVCASTILAREWVSTPSNHKRPQDFAEQLAKIGRENGLEVTVLDEDQMKELGFGALLAVGQGSTSRPRLVIMEYKPEGKAKKKIGLVGKGVTFDTGGINLKPTGSLEDMKMDMAGGAAVAATMIAASRLKPAHHIIGAVPIVENMPSGDSYRPGDIFKSYAGKTIEITNTDAEGRLILIDTLTYVAKSYKPDMMVDLATLTGACMVALGEKIAGVFSNDTELGKMVTEAGNSVHERCWLMPMPEDYKELLKSDFADMTNSANARWGGAITAALFLSDFVEKIKWAHIDIAGPAYFKKPSDYCGAGGTGFGVRLLCQLLSEL